MSYDYFLFAKPSDGAVPTLDSLVSDLRPIGAPDQLMARISALFPVVEWTPPHGEIDA